MKYNKLVRDLIPDVVSAHGERVVTRILAREEFAVELVRKLREEVDEFCESRSIEELADVLEVVYALAEERGVDRAALEEIRETKRRDRGGFDQRVFLVETLPRS